MLDQEIRTDFDLYITNYKNLENTLSYIEILNDTNHVSINTINKMIMHKLNEPCKLHPDMYKIPKHLLHNFVDMRVWLRCFCEHFGYDIAVTSDFIMMMKHMKETEKIYKHLTQNQANVHKKEFLLMIKSLLS